MKRWPLEQIISGGQTGADEAGLRAAKQMQYATGGMMPRGWKTEAGPRPEFKDLYAMTESRYDGYEHRTRYNIRESDGTLIFVMGKLDGGSGLTAAACQALHKPYQTIEWPDGGTMFHPSKLVIREWITTWQVRTLNVAGNRESKSPGIGLAVEYFLLAVLA